MSNLAQEMTSPKTVREWCRLTCARYPDVEIKNMSTSFRDGLAFCAIIHRHRPDLIDFSSLSKDNIYQNNKLAFEIAETKLGIPVLLDPNDLVSNEVPDCLSIITYVYQYYHFFNRKSYAGPASLKSSHVSILNSLTRSKSSGGLKPRKSQSDLKISGEDHLSTARAFKVCSLCFKPVHLIQRHLIDGKIYHRSCFRCQLCHSNLLSGSYTKGSDAGFLFCNHHLTESKTTQVDLNQRIGCSETQPECKFEEVCLSLGGSPILSVPYYTKKTESQDRLVCQTEVKVKEKENRDITVGLKRVVKKPARLHRPPSSVQHSRAAESVVIPAESISQQEEKQTQELSELFPACARVTEGQSRPVPAPRRMLDPSAVPVPAARNKTPQADGATAAENEKSNQDKSSPSSSHISSPSSSNGSPKVITNHPWLNIIHPGPWTQLPPAPAPIPTPRSKFSQRCKPRFFPPNPFAEDVDAETKTERKTVAAAPSGNSGSRDITSPNPFAEDFEKEPKTERTDVTTLAVAAIHLENKDDVSLNPFAEDMDEDTKTESAEKTMLAVDLTDSSNVMDKPGNRDLGSLNPFAEDMDENIPDEGAKPAGLNQTKPAVAAVSLGGCSDVASKSEDKDLGSLNPFAEYLDEQTLDEAPKPDDANLIKLSDPAVQTTNTEHVMDNSRSKDAVICSADVGETALTSEKKDAPDAIYVPAEGAIAIMLTAQTSQPVKESNQAGVTVLHESANMGGSLQNVNEAAAWPHAAPDGAQTYILPRSLSVPAITHCQYTALPSSSQSQVVCKENPFDRKPVMRKSKTFQSLPSRRGPAPGHGFPLIRRKVQTDQNISTEDLRVEMRELDKHLQTLEQRGIQLERNLRVCKNDKEEEQMLTEWFSLVHERNALVRRDTELVYLAKQQKLEERQADVEFRLRCLLNKPEGEWSDEDRSEEQQLMNELVAIIDERNQIISSLDEDRLREREEDMLLDDMMKDKELQKEGLKELKKSRGKFKPTKVFKMLNHKTDDTKDGVERKS
ncbi:MICAL-like protein 1 isoform X2 [Cheilinus undulatus]|uniref:MICAL-like protein 1 isoform X2 n=1 Tax=Cheilinus undulatus TaxID=241271 RepID=UPI001BD40A3D|nr:MICAL-like protein 1 isoform X2 [Cheilinus undulatus]